jgi:hypothetical protein
MFKKKKRDNEAIIKNLSQDISNVFIKLDYTGTEIPMTHQDGSPSIFNYTNSAVSSLNGTNILIEPTPEGDDPVYIMDYIDAGYGILDGKINGIEEDLSGDEIVMIADTPETIYAYTDRVVGNVGTDLNNFVNITYATDKENFEKYNNGYYIPLTGIHGAKTIYTHINDLETWKNQELAGTSIPWDVNLEEFKSIVDYIGEQVKELKDYVDPILQEIGADLGIQGQLIRSEISTRESEVDAVETDIGTIKNNMFGDSIPLKSGEDQTIFGAVNSISNSMYGNRILIDDQGSDQDIKSFVESQTTYGSTINLSPTNSFKVTDYILNTSFLRLGDQCCRFPTDVYWKSAGLYNISPVITPSTVKGTPGSSSRYAYCLEFKAYEYKTICENLGIDYTVNRDWNYFHVCYANNADFQFVCNLKVYYLNDSILGEGFRFVVRPFIGTPARQWYQFETTNYINPINDIEQRKIIYFDIRVDAFQIYNLNEVRTGRIPNVGGLDSDDKKFSLTMYVFNHFLKRVQYSW